MKYSLLEERIKYKFADENLLINALTHSSYTAEHNKSYTSNNERLEFIGDAYLDAIIGYKLFSIMDYVHEGELSKCRASIVCQETVAEVAKDIDLGEYVILGKGEEKCNGREKPSILSDAMEALIGSIVVDGGYDAAKRVVLDLFAEKIRLGVKGKLTQDYKTKLQEKLQHNSHNVRIEYRLINESGPDHDKSFEVAVYVNDVQKGTGKAKSKARAEQAAARVALEKGDI